MATRTASKSFNYMVAHWLRHDNLQKRLSAALRQLDDNLGLRREKLDKDGLNQRFIIGSRTSNGLRVGMLIRYTRGNNQAIVADVDDDTNVKDIQLEQLAPPPSEPGKRREFLEGILYFGIRDNHVILVQSNALQAKHLSDHLNWLLGKAPLADEEPNYLRLIHRPKASLRDKTVSGVKSIVFQQSLQFTPEQKALTESVSQSREIVLSSGAEGRANSILNSFLSTFGVKTVDFSDALETGDVEVKLEILYKKPGKRDGRQMLDGVVAALGDGLDEHVTLTVPGIGSVRGDQVKIHQSFTVPAPGGLADPATVFKTMHEWLENLLQNRMVTGEA